MRDIVVALQTRPVIKLPEILPQIKNREIRSYLRQLDLAIRHFVSDVYEDIHSGRIQHRVYTTIPTTSDVEEGEIVFYKSNSTVRLYANVSGSMKYIAME